MLCKSSGKFNSNGRQPLLYAHQSIARLVPKASCMASISVTPSEFKPTYKTAWYPVAFTADLDKMKLHRFTLLEQNLCLWFDPASNAWVALRDECPHRLVPLSEGRINTQGDLECGYHGWSFNHLGNCTRIPQMTSGSAQLERALSSPRSCVDKFAAEVKQGLLFVNATPLKDGHCTDTADIITVPELDEPDWITSDTWRDLPYDWSLLMENVLDSSHVSFTHHKSMSDRNSIGRYSDISLTEKVSPSGFKAVWPTGPRGGRLGPQKTEWRPPGFLKHHLETKSSDSLVIVYAVPSSPGRCRLINRNVVRLKTNSPILPILKGLIRTLASGWRSHVSSHTLLEDDQIFLHQAELDVELAKRKISEKLMGRVQYNPSPADACVVAFHNFLSKYGGPFGNVWNLGNLERLGPRLTRTALLDRYSQHTVNCQTCLKALSRFEKLSFVLKIGSSIFLILSLSCLFTSLGLAAGLTAATVSSSTSPLLEGRALSSIVRSLAGLVLGSSSSSSLTAAALALRSVIWGIGALILAGLKSLSDKSIQSFKAGSYPPPRNLAKDK
jgi:phenylpropionate dioxygenase-like ring-hydroxylating dioxygenase large terminal subunit